jgi:predicted transcriptional regulator
MPNPLPSLGELEVAVLNRFWQQQPCSERQIWDTLRGERKVGRTTILKTIQRLEAKGLLVRVPDTVPVQFRAAVEPERLLPRLVSRFVETTFGGAYGTLVACLADRKKLSAKDLAALRAIARKLDDDPASPTGDK